MRKGVIMPFGWLVVMMFVFYIPFLRPWWWVLLPFLLVAELKAVYLWWIAWDVEYANIKWVVLEIIPPREILIPLKAMEDAMTVMYNPLIDNANFREVWCEGELPEAPFWLSWEIMSVEGKIHFYARVMSQHRPSLESTLYSHYPDLEIQEVSDFAKEIPQNAPNEEWDLYGENFIFQDPRAYPIKTYEKFFEPQGEKISAEEKRIDPINSLLDAMSKLGLGERYWVQFITSVAGDAEDPTFVDEAQEIIGKITRRPVKKKKSLGTEMGDIASAVVFGPVKEGTGENATYKFAETVAQSESGEREMLMTPGERMTVTDIEDKIKKPRFRTTIRGLYIAKRSNWKSSHKTLLRGYTGHFNTASQVLRFDTKTRTKVHYLFRKRRVFYRSRRMIRNAVLRFPPFFPDRSRGIAILSSEELATLFHFPFKITSLAFPTVERVEHRKGGPPPNLPIE